MRNKDKPKTTLPYSLLILRLSFAPSLLSFLPPLPAPQHRAMGSEGYGQSITLCLCLFLFTLFLCSSVGSLQWDTVLLKLLQCAFSPLGTVLQEQAAPA